MEDDDLLECDFCRQLVPSMDANTCMTAHIESYDLGIIHEDCPDNYFYCKKCLNKHAICKHCEKALSEEEQEKLALNMRDISEGNYEDTRNITNCHNSINRNCSRIFNK